MTRPRTAPFALRHAPHVLIAAATIGALLALVASLPVAATAVCCSAAAAGATVGILTGRARASAALLVALVLLAGWGWGTARVASTAPAAVTAARTVGGIVEVDSAPRRSQRGIRVLVRVVAIDGVAPGTRLLADVREAPAGGLGYGRRLRISGRLGPAASGRSPRWWRSWLERTGVGGRLTVRTSRGIGRRGGLQGLRDRLRNAAAASAARGLEGDRREIVRGLALGAGEGLSEPATEAFRDAGLWHLLAVSGQNIGVVANAVFALLAAFGIARRRSAVVAMGLVAIYCLACDGGASVARAGIVGALGIAGQLRSRRRDRWYLLLLGLAVLVIHQPRAIGDPGLQLSFAAVAGIFVVGIPVGAWLEGLAPRRVATVIAQSLGATVATAPVVVVHFGELSLSGLAVNVVAVPLAGPVVVVALAGVLAGLVLPAAATACAAVAGVGADLLMSMARAAAAVPGATVTLPAWSATVVLTAGAGVVWITAHLWRVGGPSVSRQGTPARAASLAAVVAAAGAVAIPNGPRPVPWPAGPAVTVLDVGQGDAILLRSADGGAVLVDTGPPGDPAPVVAALRRAGVRRLDALAITHHQLDHSGAVGAVVQAAQVGTFLTPVAVPAEERAARNAGASVRHIAAGDVVTAGQWRLRVLWPVAGAPPPDDPNDGCLVVLAEAAGITALLTGDAESNVLSRLSLRRVDVLKVAHHGSEDPGLPALLGRLRPRVGVISAGEGNPFGHPRPPTVAALHAAGIEVYRTDRAGDTTVGATPAGLGVITERPDRSPQ